MRLKFFLLSLVFYCFGNLVHAQFHPLPYETLVDFGDQLESKSTKQLKKVLFNEYHFQKTDLIFKELIFRNDKDSKRIIEDYIFHLEDKSKNWEESEGRIRSQKLFCLEFKALAEVYLVKINNGTFQAGFINGLDELLQSSDPNIFLINIIASKLGEIASEHAVSILRKHKNLRPIVELNLYKVLTDTLSDFEIANFVFVAVQKKIANIDSDEILYLVAEKSLLAEIHDEDRMINLINKELGTPNWKIDLNADQKNYYLKYLTDQKEYFEERKERLKKEVESHNHNHNHNHNVVQPKDSIKTDKKINGTLNIIRPEDKGEDFKAKSNAELLAYLNNNRFKEIYNNPLSHKVEIANFRKIAKILGDKHSEGNLILTPNDQFVINKAIKKYLLMITSSDTKNYSEAKQQMYRFWSLAIPVLLKELDKDKYFNSSAQLLNEMKNEEVIKQVISKAFATDDKNKKLKLYRILKMMNNHYRIPKHHNRPALNENEIKELYKRLVEPALEKLKPQVE